MNRVGRGLPIGVALLLAAASWSGCGRRAETGPDGAALDLTISHIAVVAPEDKAHALMEETRQLRKTLGGEGVKAFLLPVEDIT